MRLEVTYKELMKRVLRVTGVGRDQREGERLIQPVRKTREHRPKHISAEMARKLFGEPEPDSVLHEQPEPKSGPMPKYVP